MFHIEYEKIKTTSRICEATNQSYLLKIITYNKRIIRLNRLTSTFGLRGI